MAGLCAETYIPGQSTEASAWHSFLQSPEVPLDVNQLSQMTDPRSVENAGSRHEVDGAYSFLLAASPATLTNDGMDPIGDDVQRLKRVCGTLYEHSVNRSIRPEHALHLKFRPRLKTCCCDKEQVCSKCSLEIHRTVAECRVPAWKRLLRKTAQPLAFIDTDLDVGVLNVLIKYMYLGKITSYDLGAQATGRPNFVYEIWKACKTIELHALYVSLGDKLSGALVQDDEDSIL